MKFLLAKEGDTDTNCCIAGGLIGSYIGAKNIPDDMKNIVLSYDNNKGG